MKITVLNHLIIDIEDRERDGDLTDEEAIEIATRQLAEPKWVIGEARWWTFYDIERIDCTHVKVIFER